MPILLPQSRKAKKYRISDRKARAVRPSEKINLAMRGQLYGSIDKIAEDIKGIQDYISFQSDPVIAAKMIDDLRAKWYKIFAQSGQDMAAKWVQEIDNTNKMMYEKNIARALGVDYSQIFDEKLVRDKAAVANFEATYLIKTIPEEYLNEVSKNVMLNFQQKPLQDGRSLIEQLQHIHEITLSRANVIARDQTSKINIALSQARSEELGIESYIWRTADDRRVVGTPGGMYPEGNKIHGNHYIREGKIFRWDSPPSDGHPGFAINCRCIAEPIINIKTLKAV